MASHPPRSALLLDLCRQQAFRCYFCDEPIWHPLAADGASDRRDANRATFDHLTARSAGGRRTIQNGAAACRACNGLKGSMSAADFLNFQDYLDEAGDY